MNNIVRALKAFKRIALVGSLIFIVLLGSAPVFARQVEGIEAYDAVRGWLGMGRQPLKTRAAANINQILKYENSGDSFFIVEIEGGGFAIVAGDDELEPILGYCDGDEFIASSENPLGCLVLKDIRGRYENLRTKKIQNQQQKGNLKSKNNNLDPDKSVKWEFLKSLSDAEFSLAGVSSISDIRVDKLVQTRWGQQTDGVSNNQNCYNYYTPNNYPCGCVATAMAQVMKYYEWPQTGIGVNSFNIEINSYSQTVSTRGGDGSGGAYDWADMPFIPANGVTTTECQAIGALCYDAGVSVEMSYSSSGSGAYLSDSMTALMNIFNYSNAKYIADETNLTTGFLDTVNPNLDAGRPVMLGITDSSDYSGHAIICDGYGYDMGTMYHHLNMGWKGTSDVWYNLPNIDAYYTYDLVDGCIYNIYETGSGEIISGRVVDESDIGLFGVTVTADTGSVQYSAVTNINGIYAIENVPSDTQFELTVSNFTTTMPQYYYKKTVTTGNSGSYDDISGNVWVDDIVGSFASQIPTAFSQELTCQDGQSITITLTSEDDGYYDLITQGDPDYIITILPRFGILSESGFGDIRSVPHILTSGSTVTYTHIGNVSCEDSFTFAAADGMGESTAQIDIDVPFFTTDFESGRPSGWTIKDTLDNNNSNDSNYWAWTDPSNFPKSSWDNSIYFVKSWNTYSPVDEQLITSNIDTTMIPTFKVVFDHVFRTDLIIDTTAFVDICPDSIGAPNTWVPLMAWTYDTEGKAELDVLTTMTGSPYTKIRWRYQTDGYDWYWGIDNVSFVQTHTLTTLTGDTDNDNDIDEQDLINMAFDWLGTGTGDLNSSGFVDLADFAVLADRWQKLPGE